MKRQLGRALVAFALSQAIVAATGCARLVFLMGRTTSISLRGAVVAEGVALLVAALTAGVTGIRAGRSDDARLLSDLHRASVVAAGALAISFLLASGAVLRLMAI